jgi:hypothetical protein
MVIPRISGKPPSHAALMQAPKKFGPQRLGQRNPEPKPGSRNACAMVPMPQAIMVRATTPRTWLKEPPISLTSTTGSTSVLDMRKMCWRPSAASAGSGGRSFSA